ncbi:Hypothetical protein R9X50_00583100 [Acrodontium crateriforme]|uniref:Cercosporin MFS transporter CTB4 n=1 Tax=Acrodontium crateriforme TaxID=150365 RepID=A0AAQ3M7B6_9PEZI|nr:Hypothetical protein R9X50_00583100 [Acrodontium crateriforme]
MSADVVGDKLESNDNNLVTWDGDDDPANPRNWSFQKRWLATALVSLFTFMTPIASSMVAPALPAVGRDLHISSTFELQLIFSIFLLAFVIGPLFIAPLSEVYGRMICLQLSNLFFLAFTLACGFAQTEGQMISFRFLSGLGGCAPQTLGGGVIGDLFNSDERGMAVALYSLAPLLGPSLGPLAGGFVAQNTTWRWCFWAVVIFGAVVQVLIYFTLKETYGPRILYWKAEKLRKETGNSDLRTKFQLDDRSLKSVMRHAIVRPFRLLGTQVIVQFLAAYMAVIYGILYLVLGTFPTLWTDVYHESVGIGGLNYISITIGLTTGMQLGGRGSDYIYRRMKEKAGGTGRPEFRIPLLFAGVLTVSSGLFIYGWSAAYHTHWIVPNIGAAIMAAGASCSFTALQTYTIDTYTQFAASAIGATAVVRSMAGFGFPLFAPQMYKAVGYGWGNSILAFVGLGVGLPGAVVLWFFGEKLRKKSTYAANVD